MLYTVAGRPDIEMRPGAIGFTPPDVITSVDSITPFRSQGNGMPFVNDNPAPWMPPAETWQEPSTGIPDPYNEDPYFPDPYAKL
jgi:hypothetical protein